MDIILVLRIFITLTFLILAIGGPVAIWQLRRFIALYNIRIDALERRVSKLESSIPDGIS
jgi:predicted PurR-regulated permease PerM